MAEPRVRYRRIGNEDRGRLIDAFEAQRDYIQLADNLEINRNTARSIITTYLREGRRNKLQRGGARNTKMDDEMKERLEHLIDRNPLMTLQEMKADLAESLPQKPAVSTSTIARALDGLFITLKLVEDVPVVRNAPRVLDERAEYANWFLQTGVLAHCVFVDECGYNIWTRRSQGRAPRGEPARRVVHGQRGKNCNFTFAVSDAVGLVHHTVACDTVTRETFQVFLLETARQCNQFFPHDTDVFIIYDNARPHVNAHLPENAEGVHPRVHLKKLPPYSPFLNPTEMAHSAFKAAVKRDLAQPRWQQRFGDREAARRAEMNMQQWRCNLIQQVGRNNIDAITQEKCDQWYRHTQAYMARCLARQPIDG